MSPLEILALFLVAEAIMCFVAWAIVRGGEENERRGLTDLMQDDIQRDPRPDNVVDLVERLKASRKSAWDGPPRPDVTLVDTSRGVSRTASAFSTHAEPRRTLEGSTAGLREGSDLASLQSSRHREGPDKL